MTKEEILSLSRGEQEKLAACHTSSDVLDALSYSPYIDVKRYLSRNKHTSKEILWKLYNLGHCNSDDFLMRSMIVIHPNAPEEMLIQWNAEKWYLKHPLLQLAEIDYELHY
jgi:hypothetical protein